MSHVPTLITDLAILLILAGITTLLFKKLKQPVVLGYIVAGFLASPNFSSLPNITDIANIKVWADIGVIFLLFSLGLDFSFKKMMKMGGPVVIATFTIIFSMFCLGMSVGAMFGWGRMDCLFLGGMVSMSSTTIIYKAFTDLKIEKQSFAGFVLSILVLEDILAIVLMVLLSSVAIKNNFEGVELAASFMKLIFFLVLWVVVGIYLIPQFLKSIRKWLTDETLLVIALALCFGMVYMASAVGFSAAFGAFVMGSVLSETMESERIMKLVSPVKDLFGAIFFVSVGMMVDPGLIWEHKIPILVLTLMIVIGDSLFGTIGVLLAGKPLNTAVKCGFSLTQIGEFSFIIATLGVTLGVTSDFLYPIVVSVSVITTFLTPYMIKSADKATDIISRRLPQKLLNLINRYSSANAGNVNDENRWNRLLLAMFRITLVYSIISIAVIAICMNFLEPLLTKFVPDLAGIVCPIVAIVGTSPFLRAIIGKKNNSDDFRILWNENQINKSFLVLTIVVRGLVVVAFILFVLETMTQMNIVLNLFVSVVLTILMMMSKRLKMSSILIEKRFLENFNYKEMSERQKDKRPTYVKTLLSRDLHITDFMFPKDYSIAGQSLKQLDWGRRFGVTVVTVMRDNSCINIPNSDTRLFPGDRLQIIATDAQIHKLTEAYAVDDTASDAVSTSSVEMRKLIIEEGSPFEGKSIREANIRMAFNCLIVGIENSAEQLHAPDIDEVLAMGDTLWVVGQPDDIRKLAAAGNSGD